MFVSRHLRPHPDICLLRKFMFLFGQNSPAFSLVDWYYASCIAFHFYVFCLFLFLYIFLHLSNHFQLALTSRICNHVHVFLCFVVCIWTNKYFNQLGETAHVLCCRWFCALKAPANQDASSLSVSSVRSAPRWEGFPSKSTLRSASWNPFLFIS